MLILFQYFLAFVSEYETEIYDFYDSYDIKLLIIVYPMIAKATDVYCAVCIF